MDRFIGSIAVGFGSTWLVQSGVLIDKPEPDKVQALVGVGTLGSGLYLLGSSNGFNHGYRKGAQQAIRCINNVRKGQ